MERTLELKLNGYNLIVTATFIKGCKATLETPEEPDWWFSENFLIIGHDDLTYDETLELLNISDLDFTIWIDEQFTESYKNEEKYELY